MLEKPSFNRLWTSKENRILKDWNFKVTGPLMLACILHYIKMRLWGHGMKSYDLKVLYIYVK